MREDLHGDVKPRGFPPLERMVYRVEKLDAVLPEIQPLIEQQWAETGDPDMQVNPNWAFYRSLEDSGNLGIIIAREYGRAIGFLGVLVHRNFNAKDTLLGTISTWFIEPRATRALLERTLIRNGVLWAKKKGAKRVVVETAFNHSAGRLLEAMGFAPVKIGYKINLGE